MATRAARSLRHEYELYIEHEIENYKESIPRAALLAIGDEAATRLAADAQLTLTELLLCEEVDRIIFRRLRLPAYNTWRRKRLRLHEEMRRPEHWGLSATDAVVRTTVGTPKKKGGAQRAAISGRILVAGEAAARSALFLAANGCEVTAIEAEEDAIRRVFEAAVEAGLADRVQAMWGELSGFTPEEPLRAVICSHTALDALPAADRARVIEVLKSATADGGVHLVQTLAAGSSALDELRARYAGWSVSVEDEQSGTVFLARKAVSH